MPKFRLKSGTYALRTEPTKDGKPGVVTHLTKGAEVEDPRDLDLIFRNKFERIDSSVESKEKAALKAQEDADTAKAEAAQAKTEAHEEVVAQAEAEKAKIEGRPAPVRTRAHETAHAHETAAKHKTT